MSATACNMPLHTFAWAFGIPVECCTGFHEWSTPVCFNMIPKWQRYSGGMGPVQWPTRGMYGKLYPNTQIPLQKEEVSTLYWQVKQHRWTINSTARTGIVWGNTPGNLHSYFVEIYQVKNYSWKWSGPLKNIDGQLQSEDGVKAEILNNKLYTPGGDEAPSAKVVRHQYHRKYCTEMYQEAKTK